MKKWNFKAIDVINGHVRRNDEKLKAMQAGIDLIRAGRLVIKPLVQHYKLSQVEKAFEEHYKLSQVEKAFEDLVSRKKGLFKAALVPD